MLSQTTKVNYSEMVTRVILENLSVMNFLKENDIIRLRQSGSFSTIVETNTEILLN